MLTQQLGTSLTIVHACLKRQHSIILHIFLKHSAHIVILHFLTMTTLICTSIHSRLLISLIFFNIANQIPQRTQQLVTHLLPSCILISFEHIIANKGIVSGYFLKPLRKNTSSMLMNIFSGLTNNRP